MTEERPEGRDESDRSVTPDTGDDGQEARRGSDTGAPFQGLRSAADIFGAPLTEDEWPSRRERREAERAARQAGRPEPEPFTAPASVPAAPASAPAPASTSAPASVPDPGATQAISMPEELALPGGVAGRVPPPAAVPPVPNAPDPRAISLPTARSDREARAAESRAIEDERRRTDPDGLGRSDVDWLGRAKPTATPSADDPASVASVPPALAGGPAAQPLGVEDVLPSTAEPPSFTELLRLHDDVDGAPQADRPFDWSVLGDETGEVQTALTQDSFDTNLVAAGSWAAGTSVPDDVDTGGPVPDVPDADPAGERTTPSGGSSWSLSDEAARTGEVFPGDVTDEGTSVFPVVSDPVPSATTPAPATPVEHDRDLDDDLDDPDVGTTGGPAPTAAFAPRSAAPVPPPSVLPPVVPPSAATGWWAAEDDESPRVVPADGVPPSVQPGPRSASRPPVPPTPWTDSVSGGGGGADRTDRNASAGYDDRRDQHDRAGQDDAPRPLAPEDIDQSEWQGRETSDTGVIKDLFGTEAIDQIRGLPEDTSTRMMPAVPAAPGNGARRDDSAGAAGADRDNFINEGFARLQSEGRRGKQLLVYGSIAIIVVLLVVVFLLTRWLLGNTIEDHPAAPSSSPAAAAAAHPATSGTLPPVG